MLLDKAYILLIGEGAGKSILIGLLATLKISLLSLFFGTVLGLILCGMRMSRFKPLRLFAQTYISLLRGSPLTMLLMLMYYVVFAKSSLDAAYVAVITFSLNTAAYVGEMFRSALMSVSQREIEAAWTLGFTKFQTFRYIVFPQAVKISKPVYQSTVINLIQWTSVVGYVTITDLTRVINNISSRTMEPLFMICIGMILYIGIAYLVEGIFALTDLKGKRKYGKNGGRA